MFCTAVQTCETSRFESIHNQLNKDTGLKQNGWHIEDCSSLYETYLESKFRLVFTSKRRTFKTKEKQTVKLKHQV